MTTRCGTVMRADGVDWIGLFCGASRFVRLSPGLPHPLRERGGLCLSAQSLVLRYNRGLKILFFGRCSMTRAILFLLDEDGANYVEYLLLAVTAAAIFAAIGQRFKNEILATFEYVIRQLQAARW
jgi:Flp pilus assembly pilin Flp